MNGRLEEWETKMKKPWILVLGYKCTFMDPLLIFLDNGWNDKRNIGRDTIINAISRWYSVHWRKSWGSES